MLAAVEQRAARLSPTKAAGRAGIFYDVKPVARVRPVRGVVPRYTSDHLAVPLDAAETAAAATGTLEFFMATFPIRTPGLLKGAAGGDRRLVLN